MYVIWFNFFGDSGCVSATKVEVFGIEKARYLYDLLESDDRLILRSTRP
jgi:hypothetical protein